MNAYRAFSTGHGRTRLAYLSASVSDEVEVRVNVISRIALFTSMMQVAVSSMSIVKITPKIAIENFERPFRFLDSDAWSVMRVLSMSCDALQENPAADHNKNEING